MTKEEVKQVLPLIQAFAEGKTIQTKNGSKWIDIDSDKNQFILDSVVTYQDCFRVKPEPKYRPFKNADECWQEMLKHQPFGWVIIVNNKNTSIKYNMQALVQEGVKGAAILTDNETSGRFPLEWMFQKLTFVDGAPFGVKED